MHRPTFILQKSSHISTETLEFVSESRVYTDWKQSFAYISSPTVTSTIDAVDFRGKPSAETVMFVRLKVRTDDKPYDQIVQLRGNTVGMLIVLICKGRKYALLTEQMRIATGGQLLELPAGMIDGGTFSGAAAKEIMEETGLEINESELMPLSKDPIYMSPGLLDEAMQFYAVEKMVTDDQLESFMDKLTGAAEEHERIFVRVVPFENMTRAARTDAKAHIAMQLYRSRE